MAEGNDKEGFAQQLSIITDAQTDYQSGLTTAVQTARVLANAAQSIETSVAIILILQQVNFEAFVTILAEKDLAIEKIWHERDLAVEVIRLAAQGIKFTLGDPIMEAPHRAGYQDYPR